MFKNLLGEALERLAARLDRSVKEDEIRAYVMERYARLNRPGAVDASLDREITELENRLMQLNWIGQTANRTISEQPQNRHDWQGYNWLAEGNCFGKNGLEPGCGQFLDWMDENADTGSRRETDELLEKLMRQVEVKREKALRKFAREISAEQQWMERCDISILFSRTARRRKDLRFLNTALKMNEWYLREAGKLRTDHCTVRFLTALAEQEISARELLVC
ncbi:MAG: hypothetical protein HPY72_00420 [Anaerolineae bacterium]|nr:hypothetical protein [Anaerolineae bacterium]